MSLPKFQDSSQSLMLMQTQWASQLDPVISCPLLQGRLIQGIDLSVGTNVINHKLGRKLVGWFLVGVNGSHSIYDIQAENSLPNLTLNLVSSSDVTVALWVF